MQGPTFAALSAQDQQNIDRIIARMGPEDEELFYSIGSILKHYPQVGQLAPYGWDEGMKYLWREAVALAHASVGLDLEAMVEGDYVHVLHDLVGISNKVDPEMGGLAGFFRPRYAAPAPAPSSEDGRLDDKRCPKCGARAQRVTGSGCEFCTHEP
jgi:hypothetical protein